MNLPTNNEKKHKNGLAFIVISYIILINLLGYALLIIILMGLLSGGLANNPGGIFELFSYALVPALLYLVVISLIIGVLNLHSVLKKRYSHLITFKYRVYSLFSPFYYLVAFIFTAVVTQDNDLLTIYYLVGFMILSHILHWFILHKERKLIDKTLKPSRLNNSV